MGDAWGDWRVIHKQCGPFLAFLDSPPPGGPSMDFQLTPLPNHVDFLDTPPLFEKFNKQIIDQLFRIFFFHNFLDSCDADIYIFLKIIIGKKGF